MSKTEVKQSYTIDGKVVEKVTTIGDLVVYKQENLEADKVTLHFVKNNEVLKTLSVYADCCQNSGYICDLKFTEGYKGL